MASLRKYVEEGDPLFFQGWASGQGNNNVGFTFEETSAWLAYIQAKREGLPPVPADFAPGEYRHRGSRRLPVPQNRTVKGHFFLSLGRVQVISRARHRAVLGPGKAAGGAHEATRRSHSRAAYGSRREEKRCHHHQGAISSEAVHHAFPIWRLGLFGAGWGSRFLGGPPGLVAAAEVALLLCVLRIGAGPACRNS